MPLPLILLGAGVAAVSAKAYETLKQQENARRLSADVEPLSDRGAVAKHPSDILCGERTTKPIAGSIVCCGIYHSLEHTGIWTEDNMIVELNGNGLIRAVSPERFLADRSGSEIFVASDSQGNPLALPNAAERATAQIYQVVDYHVLDNNCHNFCWQCISGTQQQIVSFGEFNLALAELHNKRIYWDLADV